MKNTGKITAVLLFLAVGTLTYTVVFNRYVRAQYVSPPTTVTQKDEAIVYTLKEYDGRIAVFSSDVNVPDEVFDTLVTDLPEYDQIQIKEGITALNKSRLQTLIEDYTS